MKLRRLFRNQSGATAIEYALVAAAISVAAIVAMGMVGNNLSNTYSSVHNAAQSAR